MRRQGGGARGSGFDEGGQRSLADGLSRRTDLVASTPASRERRRPGEPPEDQPPGDPGERDAEREAATYGGLAALGEQMERPEQGRADRRRSTARSKRRRRVKRTVIIGLVVLVVLVGGGAGYAYYLTHDLHRQEVKGLHGTTSTGAEAGTENILMVGSTSRCALKVQSLAYGLCQGTADSPPVNGVNSDVMMILHVDPAHHKLALLSIPRDLFVPNARTTGANKIDAGLYQGISQVVASIEQDFGIPIQHAVSLNFDQFANIVDALGGIDLSFPYSLFDAESGLNVRAAACVHLDGTQALQVVRARHLSYKGPGITSDNPKDWDQDPESDLSRIRRDHEFLRVLATAVAKKGLDNPLTDIDLINSVKSDLTFDQSWSVNDMASLVLDFHSVDIDSVPQLTLPVAVVTDPAGEDGDYEYKGATGPGYGQVEFTAPADRATIDRVLGISSTTDSMTGDPLPAPSTVSVSVMNGTGITDQAADTSAALGALGFHMIGVGNVASVGDVSETVVYYGSHAPAAEAAAEAVARSMSGSVIMGYDPGQVTKGAQITVVTGTQFTVNAPSSSSAGSSAGSSGATATTAPSSTTATTNPAASAIGAPSAPDTDLEPWDPRACKPGARPTAPVPNPT